MGVTRLQSHATVTHFPAKGLKREPAGYEQRNSTENLFSSVLEL
jgi:hypothetical protein